MFIDKVYVSSKKTCTKLDTVRQVEKTTLLNQHRMEILLRARKILAKEKKRDCREKKRSTRN